MLDQRTRSARLVTLFLVGCVGWNAPLLRVFSQPATVFGLPLTWAYFFALWAVLIGLLALTVRARRD
jgi:hypothetical protein